MRECNKFFQILTCRPGPNRAEGLLGSNVRNDIKNSLNNELNKCQPQTEPVQEQGAWQLQNTEETRSLQNSEVIGLQIQQLSSDCS